MFRIKLAHLNKLFRRTVFMSSTVITPTLLENSDSSSNSNSANTKWDRLRNMYSLDEFGNFSREINSVLQTTLISAFIGVCYGGFLHSREAYVDFMERNQATKFSSHLDAKRQLQNHVTINFGRGAFKWAWRLSLFCGSFVLILTTATVYRGDTSVLDYLLGGVVAGSVYQFKVGPRGMIVGGILGGVLGLFCGTLTQALFALTGTSFQDLISWQENFDKHLSDQKKAAVIHRMKLLLAETPILPNTEEPNVKNENKDTRPTK